MLKTISKPVCRDNDYNYVAVVSHNHILNGMFYFAPRQKTPLHCAVDSAHMEVVELLVKHGAKVQCTSILCLNHHVS